MKSIFSPFLSLFFAIVLAGCSGSESREPRVVNKAGAAREARTSYDWKDDETLRVRAASTYPDYAMIRQTLVQDVDQKRGTRIVEVDILEEDRFVVDARQSTMVPVGGLVGAVVSIGADQLQKELIPASEGELFWVYYVDAEVRLVEGDKFDRYEFDSSAQSKVGKPRGR